MVAIFGDETCKLNMTMDRAMEKADEVDSSDSNGINEEVKILRERLAHLDNEAQSIIETALMDTSIVVTSIDDLRPAEVPIKQHFELDNTNPIYHSAKRMAPLHKPILRKELDKNAGSRFNRTFQLCMVLPGGHRILCLSPLITQAFPTANMVLLWSVTLVMGTMLAVGKGCVIRGGKAKDEINVVFYVVGEVALSTLKLCVHGFFSSQDEGGSPLCFSF